MPDPFVAVIALACTELLPYAFEQAGWPVLVFAFIGLAIPTLVVAAVFLLWTQFAYGNGWTWIPVLIGAVAGILCQEAVVLIRNKAKIDDTLDVFAVHGVGGIFGTIMIAALGAGSWAAQLGSLAIVGVYTTVVTVVLVLVCKAITPLRVSKEVEVNGLDLSVHGERAYDLSS